MSGYKRQQNAVCTTVRCFPSNKQEETGLVQGTLIGASDVTGPMALLHIRLYTPISLSSWGGSEDGGAFRWPKAHTETNFASSLFLKFPLSRV